MTNSNKKAMQTIDLPALIQTPPTLFSNPTLTWVIGFSFLHLAEATLMVQTMRIRMWICGAAP